MDREDIIEYLIDRDYLRIMHGGESGGLLLDAYLRMGHPGYSNFTDAELREEMSDE